MCWYIQESMNKAFTIRIYVQMMTNYYTLKVGRGCTTMLHVTVMSFIALQVCIGHTSMLYWAKKHSLHPQMQWKVLYVQNGAET